MKWLLLALLLIHALIHLLGFVKEWNLAEVGQLSGQTLWPLPASLKKAVGLAWLLACLLLLIAGTMILFRQPYWWLMLFIGIIVSQGLIVLYWQDAKAGTVANVLLLVAAVIGYGQWHMRQEADRLVDELVMTPKAMQPKPVQEADLAHLPACVQQWLRHSGVVGKKPVNTVRLLQKGALRTSPGGKWMQARAVQYFNTVDPAFVWQVKANMNAAVWFRGIDRYANGRGNMLIRAYATVPVVNASGEKIDQGSMLRFLGEMCWFPSAALSPYIEWQAIDSTHAKATMQVHQSRVDMAFEFSEGRLVAATAMRYMGGDNNASLQPWHIRCREWKNLNGYTIPTMGEVAWKLSTGDFSYYEWEITEIAYDLAR